MYNKVIQLQFALTYWLKSPVLCIMSPKKKKPRFLLISQEEGLLPSRFCYLGVNMTNLGAMKYRHQLAYQNVQASYSRLITRMQFK